MCTPGIQSNEKTESNQGENSDSNQARNSDLDWVRNGDQSKTTDVDYITCVIELTFQG